ncbi:MAG: phage terminase large subunit, partial [Pseudomonadota bacterium]
MTCSFPLFVTIWNRLQNQTTPILHIQIAKWLETEHETERARLLLMAFRSCGKSTLVGLFCVWILWRLPDTRILVLSADLALAKKTVRNVKRILERHPLTRVLVPKDSDQWGSDRFTIVRDMELRDPSMLAKGISANLTGTRADVIICDDVEVPKTCDTAEKRELLRQRLHELDYILTPNGMQLYVGTPHCWHTIYAEKAHEELNEEAPFLEKFTRLTIPILNGNGESIWPERFPLDVIESIKRKTGPLQF